MCWWVGGELEGEWGRETFPGEVTSELRPRRWERSHAIEIWGRTRAEVFRWDPVLLVGEKERGLCLREESGMGCGFRTMVKSWDWCCYQMLESGLRLTGRGELIIEACV